MNDGKVRVKVESQLWKRVRMAALLREMSREAWLDATIREQLKREVKR
jgi:predicted HicB family RNase H-like nuclease